MDNQKQILHLKGLNGLRAFSAIAVVVSHLRLTQVEFGLPKIKSLQLAQYGVTIFFTLSGFLITYLLLKEKSETQTINVKDFYIRRILRIWPLYYLYLILTVATIWLTKPDILPGYLFFYVFMMANVPFIMDRALPNVNHFWSLGVEEQFYLFWPLLIKRLKKPFQFILIFILLFIFLKGVSGFLKARYFIEIPYLFFSVNRFDCMAVGVLGAFIVHDNKIRMLKVIRMPMIQITAWGTFVLLATNHFNIHPLVNHEVISLVALIAIINLAFNPKSLVSLEYPIFDLLGKISFGIYVYHPLVIFAFVRIKKHFFPDLDLNGPQLLGLYAIIVGATVLVAFLSYNYFEKRYLNYKSRFTIIKSIPNAR